jgi:hypothetical protein
MERVYRDDLTYNLEIVMTEDIKMKRKRHVAGVGA